MPAKCWAQYEIPGCNYENSRRRTCSLELPVSEAETDVLQITTEITVHVKIVSSVRNEHPLKNAGTDYNQGLAWLGDPGRLL